MLELVTCRAFSALLAFCLLLAFAFCRSRRESAFTRTTFSVHSIYLTMITVMISEGGFSLPIYTLVLPLAPPNSVLNAQIITPMYSYSY